MRAFFQISQMITVLVLSLIFTPVFADDNYVDRWGSHTLPGVNNLTDPLYEDKCGQCHMAYQPGLLPAQSWEQIILSVNEHFGETLSLNREETIKLLKFLLDNAAGRNDYHVSNRMMQNIKYPPKRITRLPYFIHTHQSVTVKDKALAQCDSCHTQAKKGLFNKPE